MRVGVGEPAGQQHLVRREPGAGHGVVRLERRLLDLGVVVGDVAVQRQLPHRDERVVAVRPDLGEVERVEPVGLRVVERHDLHVQRPAREVAVADVLVEVALVVVGVDGRHLVGLVLGEELDALVGLEVVLHPELRAGGVDPHVGVAAVAVHVPPGPRDAPVAHQPGHLVRRLGRQRPEVPLHVVVAQVVVGAALLAADEVLELHRVADEEHRGVVADDVEVALGGVELQRRNRAGRARCRGCRARPRPSRTGSGRRSTRRAGRPRPACRR